MLFFDDFYSNLKNKKNIFYMYFSTGLLHFALESVSQVPSEVNLIILAAGVTDDERRIMEQMIKRPICYFSKVYTDGVIWELLFYKNQFNFGWLDVDCFVFDKTIFEDLANIDNSIGVNTVWAGKYDRYQIDEWLANTFLVFYNAGIIHEIMMKYEYILPKIAKFPEKNLSVLGKDSYTEIDMRAVNVIKNRYPSFEENTRGYFDTTHLYQLFVLAENYKIQRIRNVDSLREYYFEGALHLGGCNRIHVNKLDDPRTNVVFKFNMRMSYLLLCKYLPILAQSYNEIYQIFTKTLKENGLRIDKESMRENVKRYMERNGMNRELINLGDKVE